MVGAWIAATPDSFRFSVKAQRSASIRALGGNAAPSIAWLTEPLGAFGERLGSVLFRVPADIERDDARLRQLLSAWPNGIPLTVEFRHSSWHIDEVFTLLREAGATLCTTELPDDEGPPDIQLTGSFLYLRLRRVAYTTTELDEWANRLVPFLEAGHDAYVFFRHDETGDTPHLALYLGATVGRLLSV